MQKIKRIEFFILKKCINNCIFCSERDRFNGLELPLSMIKKTLVSQRKKGIELVHFMGGEPTIHSRFREILILAKELGYKTHIITNGIKFAEKKFCKTCLPYLDEIMFSIHGHNAKVHNANTRNPTSFIKLTKGIENASRYKKTMITATTSITKLNFRHSEKIAKLLNSYSIKDLQFISIIPSGNGRRNYLDIMPRMAQLRSPINQAVNFCLAKGMNVRFAGIPMCVLGKHYIYSSDLWEEFKLDNRSSHDNKLKLWKEPDIKQEGYRIDIGRIKTKKCTICSRKDICGGLYQLYYDTYKDRELKPFI